MALGVSTIENIVPRTPMKSWNKSSVKEEVYANVLFDDLLNSENTVKEIVRSLIIYGFAFINKVPPTTEMTEVAITR